MARFIIKRLCNALLTIFIVITCTFFMIKLSPGNPFANEKTNEAAIKALEILKDEDNNTYNTSVILMTDGKANVGTYADLYSYYKSINSNIPIYSIMFGNANQRQLQDIANLSNAKVFDGKTNLVEAFKEVRGYN